MDKAKTTDFEEDFYIADEYSAAASAIEAVPGVAPGLGAVSRMPPGVQPMPIFVGDTVLLRISGDAEIRTLRPVLVVRVISPACLSGSLFLDPDIDWSFEWVRQNLFVQLNEANRIVPIKGAWFGEGMGQWLPK